MDEGKLRQAADRGLRAKTLLENEMLQEAFSAIEAALLDEWKSTVAGEDQRREDAWRSFKLLGSLKGYLSKHVSNGSAAAKELVRIKDPSFLERFK